MTDYTTYSQACGGYKFAPQSLFIKQCEQEHYKEEKGAEIEKNTAYFTITHYCACEQCCGKTDGITASGTQAEAGRTIAVDPDVIPLGTEVLIDGITYVAEDIGGAIQGNRIDIYCNTHAEALEGGVYEALAEWEI